MSAEETEETKKEVAAEEEVAEKGEDSKEEPEEKQEEKEEKQDEDADDKPEETDKPKRKRSEKPKVEEKAEDEDEDEEAKEDGSYWNVDPSAKRQRKSLEHFHPDAGRLKEDVVVKKGSGTPLNKIPTVVNFVTGHAISKSNPKDPLKVVAKWLWNRAPQPKELKEKLLEFSGLVFDDQKAEDAFKAKVEKKIMKELKEIMVCLALERNGTQKELAQRLFEFLKKPSAAQCKGKAPPGSVKKPKRKSESSKSSKGSKKGAKKKPAAKKSKKEESEDDEDEEEEDDEEEEEEEEEEEAESPPKKKQKPAPKAKASPKASPKKKAKKEEKEDSDDDDDADEPLVKAKESDEITKLKEHVKEVCAEADLSTLTLRMVREALAEKYKVDTAKYKDDIRRLVDEHVEAHG